MGGGGKKSSAWTSGLKECPSGKGILQNKASQHPLCPTRLDGQDAHFVIADVSKYVQTRTGKADLGVWKRWWGRGGSVYCLSYTEEMEWGDHLVCKCIGTQVVRAGIESVE